MTDNHLKEAHDFITLNEAAALSTISSTVLGYPFGSVVPYDIDENGRLIIFVAGISEHYRNLSNDPRASLLIFDRFGINDIQKYSRATVVGDFEKVPDNERASVEKSYWARFPNATDRGIAHTFHYFRCTPKRIRWIGGFGSMSWIPGDKFCAYPRDPIAYIGSGAIDHMNQDHAEALRAIAQTEVKTEIGSGFVRMVCVNSEAFTIEVGSSENSKRYSIKFPSKVTNSNELRKAMVELTMNAKGLS